MRRIAPLLALALAVSACGEDRRSAPSPSRRPDSGLADPDTGVAPGDAGTLGDAGSPADSGPAPDTGSPADGGGPTDAGFPVDSGPTPDAGFPVDSGATPDAGAPIDAGSGDAGSAWTVVHSRNQPQLRKIFGTSATALWGLAFNELWRWDGQRWSPVVANIPTSEAWGATADDVWLVGREQIHHFDGQRWQREMRLPGLPIGTELRGVFGLRADDVWVVGQRAGTNRGLVLHFDGQAWTEDTSLPADAPALNVVRIAGNGQVWAGGEQGALYLKLGTSWVRYQHAIGTGDVTHMHLLGTSGELWAIGSSRFLARYDGASWQAVGSPSSSWAHAVWGTSPQDVWVAGAGFLQHWDGTRWTAERLSNSDRIYTLFGVGNALWAAGSAALGGGLIRRFDGMAWTDVVDSPTTGRLGAIAGSAADDIWASGEETLHYDGLAWTRVPDPLGRYGVSSLFACGRNELWTVAGRNLVHYAAGVTTSVVGPELDSSNDRLTAIGGTSCADVWAFGTNTSSDEVIILHLVNGSWSRLRLFNVSPGTLVSSLVASGPNDIWAHGSNYRMLHYDGALWSETAYISNLPQSARVYGLAANDLWVVGPNRFFHYDGTAWTPWPNVVWGAAGSANAVLSSVWGRAPNGLWAVGDEGTILFHR